MKIIQTTISDELKKLILRMKNNEATGIDHLQSFNYGGNYLKKYDGNCDQREREREERQSRWKKWIICPLFR